MGPPACGKGTIGKLLSEKLKIPLISGGNILRSLPETHPRYKELHAKMDVGDLAPDDLVASLYKERTLQPDCANGYILDGWARDLGNLDYFNPTFDLVLFLNISEDTVVKRVSGRRTCEATGETINVFTMPDYEKIQCPSGFIQREDDKEEAVRERLKVYHEHTAPVVDYYKKQRILVEVDGEPLPEEVFKNVCVALSIH